MITALAHACFTVSDLERALRFYRDGLGLKHAFDFVNAEGRRHGVYLHVGGRSFIELFEGQHATPATVPAEGPSYKHICLEVDDVESTVRTLRERGLEVGEIKLGKDQSYQAWLTDPDGNRIELHCYTPQSWQAPFLR